MKKSGIFYLGFPLTVIVFALVFAACIPFEGSIDEVREKAGGGDPVFYGIFTDIAELGQYLNNFKGSNSKLKPLPIKVGVNLGAMNSITSNWGKLLTVIDVAGKYVSVDLSTCTLATDKSFYFFDHSIPIDRIISIILPDEAESIEPPSFTPPPFGSIKRVEGRNIKNIGVRVFSEWDNLTEVSFPVVESINSDAFRHSGLVEANFDAVTEIKGQAFNWCTNLIRANLPLVTKIGQNAFMNCTNLSTVSIPSVVYIEDSAFAGCANLSGEIKLPEVKEIGSSVFSGCAITKADLPVLEKITIDAFGNCSKMTSVRFPSTLQIIGTGNVFVGCTSLVFNLINNGGSLSTTENGEVLVRSGTELVSYPTAKNGIYLPGILKIGAYALYNCVNLSSVSFPDVTEISDGAFSGCTNLETASFPLVENVGQYVFSYCGKLKDVDFSSITSIGRETFEHSAGNLSIKMGSAPPQVGPWMFYQVSVSSPITVTVKVPSGDEISYNTSWQTAFSGVGNDGDSGIANANVTIVIQGI